MIEQLANAMIMNGIPEYIRSGNSPKFIAKELFSGILVLTLKPLTLNQGAFGKIAFVKALTSPLGIMLSGPTVL